MNRHQVITGAANNSESSVAIGSVENNHFTAYGSGGNLIILSSNFDRVQIISSKNISNNSNDILKCIDCTLDTGKIAAAYGNRVYIFEPTPSAKKPSHNIKYKWVKVGAIEFESEIVCISWNNDGSRLLAACERGTIQMWVYDANSSSTVVRGDAPSTTTTTASASKKESASEVRFSVFSTDESTSSTIPPSYDDSNSSDDVTLTSRYMFKKIWQTTLSNPVKFLKFSPDGSLFASFGENDRLVKVWHELKYVSKMLSPLEPHFEGGPHNLDYGFVYLNHPRAVTSLSWRQISRFMPRGTVSNSLITSCKDNICRIWTETLIPDDGLLHAHQYDSTYKSIAKSSSHKRKLLNKLHRMRLHPHFPHLFNSKTSNDSKPLSQISESNQPSTLHINNSQSTLNLAGGKQPSSSVATTPSGAHHHLSPSNLLTPQSQSQSGQQLTSSLSCSELYLKPSPSFAGGTTSNAASNPQSTQAQYMQHHHTSHFHLAGFIDPEAGIPLHLIKNGGGGSATQSTTSKAQQAKQQPIQSQFVVHWMNNKDFHFTYLAELCSKEIYEKILKIQAGKESAAAAANGDASSVDSASTSGDENESGKRNDNEDEDDDAGVRFDAKSADIVVIKTKSDNSYDVFENINLDDETKGLLFGKSIDQKLDSFIKDWYASHDILFCVHPLDGSILIWVVDWLDEFMPNSYRQAQVSFHAKLPNTIPIGDAVSLSNSIYLYTDTEPIRIRNNNTNTTNTNTNNNQKSSRRKARKALALNNNSAEEELSCSGSTTQAPTQPFSTGVVYMVSKHSNGTLNLWKLQFQENSKYQSLVNVSHMYRVCGHRFRVGHITSHPILPFLLTNSAKWNSPDNDIKGGSGTGTNSSSKQDLKEVQSSPFCADLWQHSHKSLIIWGVEPIGPLSKTGGIYELARIDSPKRNAFENIAWFPCFLPSFTLGNSSSSPSTLFASTDADQITIYQAVFDARTLLHDLLTQKASASSAPMSPTKVPNSISFSSTKDIPYDNFNVVSIQSTARPGCIIELEQLPDSGNSGWTKADLFHIYQEGFVVRRCSTTTTTAMNSGGYPTGPSQSATSVDSSISAEARFTQFNETFYLILLEKKRNMSERVHMWKVNIQSSPMIAQSSESNPTRRPSDSRLTITNTRVCQQDLPLPESVYVVCADPAAADLSSSSMFTINKAPYLFSTACSDGVVRFWSCRELDDDDRQLGEGSNEFEFVEWKLDSTMTSSPPPTQTTATNEVEPSQVKIDNFPLAISCSYNSRFAVAYRKQLANNDAHYYVRIYECESTGGSEWKCEDCIHFKNIMLPELDSGINFDYIIGKEKPIKPVMSSHSFKNIVLGSNRGGSGSDAPSSVDSSQPSHQTPEIPSTAAKMSIKKKFFPTTSGCTGNQPNHEDEVSLHYNKCLIKLDWASTENGSHILTIGLGNKIYVYSCVSKEIFNLTKDDKHQVHENNGDDSLVKWILFRSFELDSADDMQALPTQIKWVRDGLLIIGLDTEMQVYSQWSSLQKAANAAKKSITQSSSTTTNSNTSATLSVPTIQISKQDTTDGTSTKSAGTNKQVSSLIIPKNHSVMDLNKLNKAASTGMAAKDAAGAKTPLRNNDMLNLGLDEVDTNTNVKNPTSLTTTAKKQTTTRFFDETEILEIVQDSGLFMQAKHARPVLPQYHPKQLLELMNAGKINRVKAILMHLTRCIIDFELKTRNKNTVNSEKKLKSRKMSVCYESEIPEEQPLNYLEVDTIPPLPLFALYAADDDLLHDRSRSREMSTNTKAESAAKEKSIDLMDELKSDPFDANEMNLTYDNDEDMSAELKQKMLEKRLNEEKAELKRQILNETHSTTNYFNSKVCRLLVEYLSYVQLNGLTSIDQMYLVALADTVTNVKCDVSFTRDGDLFSRKAAFMASTGGGGSDEASAAAATGSIGNGTSNQVVDNCGFKFLLALRSYNYLMRTLPVKNRERLRQIGIGTFNFAWAFHSECEHELLEALPFNSSTSGDPLNITWADLKQYGVGWWLKSPQQLRQLMEKVAKCAFQAKMDPLDAAMFYLAMRKKGVLCGLFKTVKDTKMADFFKNDFGEAKWQTAALKNAFVLLGKQRFEHAVSFFLLAGRLKDAIEVCLRNLADLQLALVIVRLYETDFESLSQIIKSLLSVEILGHKIEPNSAPSSHLPNTASSNSLGKISQFADPKHVSPDPFLRSMSYWYTKDYKQALNTLFEVDINSSKKSAMSIISHVFNFYSFLKHHPLVLKQQQLEFSNGDGDNSGETPVADRVTPVERRLHFVSAYYHLINGCPLLALDVLSKLPKYIYSGSKPAEKEPPPSQIKVSAPMKIEKAQDFDWSTPMDSGRRFQDDDDELDLHISSDDDDDDEEPDLFAEKKKKEEEKKAATATTNNIPSAKLASQQSVDSTATLVDGSKNGKIVDTFAQQLKFISCLKILIEEMSTLANGFEVVGGQLRYYMYYWLERETELLKKLGDHKSMQSKESNSLGCELSSALLDEQELLEEQTASSLDPSRTAMLHEQVLREQKTFQEKINRVNKRKDWLRSNELLLRTFLSYCSLHGSSAAGLNSVKMELVLLMQELVEDRSMKQLLYPLRVQTSIPLLSASIASSKSIVAGPIQMIKSIGTDILATIIGIGRIPTIFDYSVLIATLKESAISLSSCIYQCLCDSDVVLASAPFVNAETTGAGMQGFSRNILYKSSYLMSGVRNRTGGSVQFSQKPNRITTSPKNWPGISSLNKLLEREQDTEAPKLKVLLLESLVSVYCSLLINAMVFYDCSTLWRLLAKPWDETMWNRLFGGGCHSECRYRTQATLLAPLEDEGAKQRMRVNNKLGYKLSFSTSPMSGGGLAGPAAASARMMMGGGGEEKVEIRESFVAPEISMINFFLSDPEIEDDVKMANEEYDSDEELSDSRRIDRSGGSNREDTDGTLGGGGSNISDFEDLGDDLDSDDDPNRTLQNKRSHEHMNPKSYSWCLMRYAILKLSISSIGSFLNVIGIEAQEIAIQSPLIHQVIKSFEKWSEALYTELNAMYPGGPPADYMGELAANNSAAASNSTPTTMSGFGNVAGPKIFKYQALLDPAKTPFIIEKSTYPVRRLWLLLVTRKSLYDLFIRNIILKGSKTSATDDSTARRGLGDYNAPTTNTNGYSSAAYKIVHKDQEAIYSFCLNERDKNVVAFCTAKDIIEIDMKGLLMRSSGREDECDIDLSLQGTPRSIYDNEVYVVREANPMFMSNSASNQQSISSSQGGTGGGSSTLSAGTPNVGMGGTPGTLSSQGGGVGGNQVTLDISHQKPQFVRANDLSVSVLLKRSIKETRRLSSHPTLPYYLSGTNESVVKLWHWGSSDALSSFKQTEKGSSAKITKLQFNSQGNKFGVSDVDGYLHLYQLLGCSFKAYLTLKCYQIINDFLFIDSSSILLTIGTSNDSYVVSLWDTLLPSNKSLIKSFKEADTPSGTCVAYSLLNHLVYCGNRKGEVNIYDIRMHKKIQRLIAHESCVKAVTLDADEYFMATGSSEGNVKLWNSKTFECLQVFHNEHSKSSIIRSLNSGVNQLTFTSQNQLLSCGADGTIVIRNLA